MSTFDPIGERGELFSGHRLAQDVPGAELRLEWQGTPPRLLGRSLPLFFVVLAFTAVPLAVWWIWGDDIQKLVAQGVVNMEFLIPFAAIFAVGGFFALTYFFHVLAQGRDNGYWKSLTWDAGQKHFQGEFRGTPLIGSRKITVPLEKIYRVKFSIGAEGKGPVLIAMQLDYIGNDTEVLASLEVAHVDRRVEAMDLLFRIARIIGLKGYTIELNSHPRLDVAVLHPPLPDDEEDEEDVEEYADEELAEEIDQELASPQKSAAENDEEDEEDEDYDEDEDDDDFDYHPVILAVPDDRSFARYEMNAPPAGFSEPTIEIPEFDPDHLAVEVTKTHVTSWEPGKNVRVHRPPLPLAAGLGVSAIAGVVAGIVASWGGYGIVSLLLPVEAPWWAIFLTVAGVVAAALFVYLLPKLYEREVVFDWEGRQVRWRVGSRSRELPLSAVQGLTLAGLKNSRRIKHVGVSIAVFDCRAEVRMTHPEGEDVVIETDNWEYDLNRSYRKLLPFTVALARELGVPWSVTEQGPRRGLARRGLALGRGRAILLTLSVLVVTSLIGWHAYVDYLADADAKAALAEIERGGGKVTFVANRPFRNLHELKDVWRVEFPDGIDDAKLAALAGPLSRVPRLDLALGGTQITDVGAVHLAGLKTIAALDLSNTRVTSSSIEDMRGSKYIIEVVDVSNVNVSDRVISFMGDKLAVIQLSGTRVGDQDMGNLTTCSKLKYVGVANTLVTPDGAQRLRNAIPNVIVEEK